MQCCCICRASSLSTCWVAPATVADHGLLAFTVKEGDGDGWSRTKLGLPRHFTYWREAAVRSALQSTRWQVRSLERVMCGVEPWLFVLAKADDNLGGLAR